MGSQKLLFLVFAEKQYIYKSNRQKQQKQLDRFQHLPEHANFNLNMKTAKIIKSMAVLLSVLKMTTFLGKSDKVRKRHTTKANMVKRHD